MVLIDSLYINNSGGFRLLEYLVAELQKRKADFYLLADSRCKGKFDDCQHAEYMDASMRNRRRFYLQHRNVFASVLCFGNIPTPIKMDVPVYTYFHNINLLTLAEASSFSVKVKSWLKREVFRYYKKNTDFWLVQTTNTANELVKNLDESENRVKLMPFYELPVALDSLSEKPHGGDYVYVSDYYKGAKGHETLLDAWRQLHNKGIDITLHLTIHERNAEFIDEIKKARNEGVRVINHGFVSFEKVIELYRNSKALIYPSHNESLGLGIIEAVTAGCDIIGADLPYLHAICKPSVVFDPYSSKSIVDAVIEYEKGTSLKTTLLINNRIEDMVGLLLSGNE